MKLKVASLATQTQFSDKALILQHRQFATCFTENRNHGLLQQIYRQVKPSESLTVVEIVPRGLQAELR